MLLVFLFCASGLSFASDRNSDQFGLNQEGKRGQLDLFPQPLQLVALFYSMLALLKGQFFPYGDNDHQQFQALLTRIENSMGRA